MTITMNDIWNGPHLHELYLYELLSWEREPKGGLLSQHVPAGSGPLTPTGMQEDGMWSDGRMECGVTPCG